MKYWAPINSPGGMNGNDAYVDANKSIGIQGSIPTFRAFEQPLRGLQNLVQYSNLIPDGSINDIQISQAVRSQYLNWVGTFGGTNNALTCNFTPAINSLAAIIGCPVRGIISATNTSTCTLAVNGLQAAITYPDNTPIASGDLVTGTIVILIYDGTKFQILSMIKHGAGGGEIIDVGSTLFNVKQIINATRTVLSNIATSTTIYSGTYNKISGTSNIVMWSMMPTYVKTAWSYGPYWQKLTIGGVSRVAPQCNNTNQDARGTSNACYLLPGVASGAQAITVELGRTDSMPGWYCIINPTHSDDPWWPASGLQTTYVIGEIEP